jgi:hypothetical protein
MALLYGRAGRLTAKNAGFRPGQWAWCSRSLPAAGGSGWTCDPETKQCAKQLVGGRYDTEDECETKCA